MPPVVAQKEEHQLFWPYCTSDGSLVILKSKTKVVSRTKAITGEHLLEAIIHGAAQTARKDDGQQLNSCYSQGNTDYNCHVKINPF